MLYGIERIHDRLSQNWTKDFTPLSKRKFCYQIHSDFPNVDQAPWHLWTLYGV
jgi:hypothetical protein